MYEPISQRTRIQPRGGVKGKIDFSYSIYAHNTPVSTPEPPKNLAQGFQLEQNYPNPFNPTTHITFQIPAAEKMTLKIYNSLGQLIRILLDSKLNEGEYTVVWDGLDDHCQQVASGIYLYRLQVGKNIKTKKMMIIR